MKKIIYIISALCCILSFTSCEADNLSEPEGILTGSVIDAVTGKPIITQQPDGFRIKYEEISWSDSPIAQYFWAMADGTFNNKRLFDGTYRVTPVEGPFETPESKNVDVRGRKTTTVEFTVTPYISFSNVSIVREGLGVRATFTLQKNISSSIPQDYIVFVTPKTPYVGTIAYETNLSTGSVSITNDDFGKPISVLLSENYESGKTYYVRIGARCENASGRYNYTEVVSIQM